MSALVYLVAMAAVAWLVLWTIRDPKEPNWEWWPIEWWPFDTQSEAAASESADAEGEQPTRLRRQQATPWRQRRTQQPNRAARSSLRSNRPTGRR